MINRYNILYLVIILQIFNMLKLYSFTKFADKLIKHPKINHFSVFSNSHLFRPISTARTDEIIKPITDSREYFTFTLKNGIKVLVVSDKNNEKSAASLTVGVGASSDPIEYPGLAHFTGNKLGFAFISHYS